MPNTDLGPLSTIDRGAYSAAVAYTLYEAVSYNRGYYFVKTLPAGAGTLPAGTLPTDTAYWAVMCDPSAMNTGTEAANAAAQQANVAAAGANKAAQAANVLTGRVDALEWKASIHKYVIRWDKQNAACTRMHDAASITTDTAHFAHRGSVDASYSNPFDSLYPWSERKLCKVSRATYATIYAAGGNILDAITQWEGEAGFALDGSGDFDAVYTPAFWGYRWEDASYVYWGVADGEVTSWQHFPATVGGRYPGSRDASGNMTSIAGAIAWRGDAMSTMHANARAQRLTLDDLWTWGADTLLMSVEYATLNSQNAVGQGCCSLYAQGATGGEYHTAADTAVGATTLTIPNAVASALAVGGVIDIGTRNATLDVCSVYTTAAPTDLDRNHAAYTTHKQVAVSALPAAVTTAHFITLHGCYNAPDVAIGSKSGYLGTNGRCNAYYRGRVAHGNFWRYLLGVYRQKDTNHIWVAGSRADAQNADTLDTVTHRDTGLVLPSEASGAASGGYISSLLLDDIFLMAPFCGSIGGNSNNPVGDYSYVPAVTAANTVAFVGAGSGGGLGVGRFCAAWDASAGHSGWDVSAFPHLIHP